MSDDNVIDFVKKVKDTDEDKKKLSAEEEYQHDLKLCDLAEAIDIAVDLSIKNNGISYPEAMAVISHRLGSYLNNFQKKEMAYFLMDGIIREQAGFNYGKK